jgi:hypothetical protein
MTAKREPTAIGPKMSEKVNAGAWTARPPTNMPQTRPIHPARKDNVMMAAIFTAQRYDEPPRLGERGSVGWFGACFISGRGCPKLGGHHQKEDSTNKEHGHVY